MIHDKVMQAIRDLKAIAAIGLDKGYHKRISEIIALIEGLDSALYTAESIIGKLKELHPPKYRHNCPEWDEMEIDEYNIEFAACSCFKEVQEIRRKL